MSTTPSLMTTPAWRVVFNIIVLVPALVGLPMLLIAIAFGKDVRRGTVFTSFICATTVLAIAASLLTLAGQQEELYPKSRALCFVQTAILDGAVGMTPVSSLALLLQLAIGLYQRRYGTAKVNQLHQMWLNIVLIGAPLLVFLALVAMDLYFFVQIAQGTMQNVDVVNPAFYCKLVSFNPLVPLAASETPLVMFIIVISSITLVVEAGVGYMLWQFWRSQECRQQQGGPGDALPIGRLARLTAFTLYRIAIFIVALQVVRDPVRMFAAAEFFHGAIPFVVFLIFGLQRDILLTWAGWFKRIPEAATWFYC